MAQLFLPDTDVLIDFLRGYQQSVDFIKVNASQIILSTIVIAELYAGVKGKQELTMQMPSSLPLVTQKMRN